MTLRPTRAEVDLGAIVANHALLAALLDPGARLIPVLKADAYGHGAVPVARALAARGAGRVAVAIVEEGAALRASGFAGEILILEGAWPGQEAAALRDRLTPAVHSAEGIERLEHAAREAAVAVDAHLKVDTGMARLGAPWDALEPIARELGRARRVRLAATFSHLACAEEADGAFTREQARRFETAVAALREHGIDPGELHLANSGGLLHHPELRRFGARPGIALYGYPPAPERTTLALRPALRLCSEIGRLADLAPGASVGYNRRFVAAAPTRAATVPIGYADGYRRGLTGRAEVIVRDRRAPLLGAVSMDMVVVDVTAIRQAAVGDEVVLLGSTPSCRVDAADLAAAAGTIPYEILCGISARVPRRYT